MDTVTRISHPGMSKAWFDLAVHRAMLNGLEVRPTRYPSQVYVTSASRPNVRYLVTRRECPCPAGRQLGRCQHRALAIATWDVFGRTERRPDSRPAA